MTISNTTGTIESVINTTTKVTRQATEVFAHIKIEGLHHWPSCDIKEVGYLKNPHRHTFHIKAYVNVNHLDRDVEFIELSHQIRDYLISTYYSDVYLCCNFQNMSCEAIALELSSTFNLSRCEVNEDGEGGAIVTTEEVQ